MSDDKEEQGKQSIEDRQAIAQQEATRLFSDSLMKAEGKSIDEIPEGPYCYTNHFSAESIERLAEYEKAHPGDSGGHFALWIELHTEIDCPYWEYTDHGTIRCNFLEDEVVGGGGEDEEKALIYFGSEEAREERCQGGVLLEDQVRYCTQVVDAIRKGS
jgi:hypothetical protein